MNPSDVVNAIESPNHSALCSSVGAIVVAVAATVVVVAGSVVTVATTVASVDSGLDVPAAAVVGVGRVGVLHGSKSYVLQDEHGQIIEAHSISAGLDYPGVGPELSELKDSGRLRTDGGTDAQAQEGIQMLCREEGILPALARP